MFLNIFLSSYNEQYLLLSIWSNNKKETENGRNLPQQLTVEIKLQLMILHLDTT